MVYTSYSVKIVGKVTRLYHGYLPQTRLLSLLSNTHLLPLLNFLCEHLKHLQGMMGVHTGVRAQAASVALPFLLAKVRSNE